MSYSKQRSRESRAAIERLYITMRHLFIRGSYKPMGVSGQSLIEALHILKPEIYGAIDDGERVDMEGLLYVAERLPKGIEECRFIQLVAREGFEEAGHSVIMPMKRRRNCYRIDNDRMYVEMSRGRSDIYDILTHLTYLYIEAEKIRAHAMDLKDRPTDNWMRLSEVVEFQENEQSFDEKRALVYLSNVLGRTVEETRQAVERFERSPGCNSLYHFAYWLGKVAIDEYVNDNRREVMVSAKLKDVVGHHIYGEKWAYAIKDVMAQNDWLERPVHIISANLHSFLNTLYGFQALPDKQFTKLEALAVHTSSREAVDSNRAIREYALENGLTEKHMVRALMFIKPLLLVMDYAFGEQAYECMDELLKPFESENLSQSLNVKSVSVMGKAGILEGNKGDLMIPTAHIFEGTADNYPFENDLSRDDFKDIGLGVYEGPMITVLGTSLQNRDVLHHFQTSTWNAIGLEMEGAHYQKAIQSAARIRKSIAADVKVRYAYYASDNPLVTGSTLSSGSLGAEGVRPTYWITLRILEKILS